jgi:hypothetical protein
MELLIYLLGKYAAYTAWCYFGLSFFNRVDAPVGRALGFGLVRLLMGIAFGFAIAFLVSLPAFDSEGSPLLPYLLVYVPVRVVEWTIMAKLMLTNASTSRTVYWVLGGIALSCLADIPLFAMTGGVRPSLGRIAC